ncbi:MAG: Ig-like domain-containing protein, partial [Acidobacteriota bacterium]
VLGELQRKEGKKWVTVFRSLNPTWAVAGLPAGNYRLHFPARLDEEGNIVKLADEATVLQVNEGRITEAHAILEHISPALVIVGVVTVVVIAVLLAEWLKDHDLPEPPLPPPDVLEAVIYISIDLASGPEWRGVSDRQTPTVTSHFPAAGALVAARLPKVVFAFSEPLQPVELEAQGVTVMGEASGIIRGQVHYDAEHWWVVWTPQQDLAPGDTFHATLSAGAVEDLAGNEVERPASFSFRSAR